MGIRLCELYVLFGPLEGVERELARLERGLRWPVAVPPLPPEEVEWVKALETVHVT